MTRAMRGLIDDLTLVLLGIGLGLVLGGMWWAP